MWCGPWNGIVWNVLTNAINGGARHGDSMDLDLAYRRNDPLPIIDIICACVRDDPVYHTDYFYNYIQLLHGDVVNFFTTTTVVQCTYLPGTQTTLNVGVYLGLSVRGGNRITRVFGGVENF